MSDRLDALKNDVVTQMFVDTADQNYVIARWAYHRELFLDFFWNACQALEKYLKASLLLNGRCARHQGHNLIVLFDEVEEYAADFFPPLLIQPPALNQLTSVSEWDNETPRQFIKRFSDLGDGNNRYNVFGYTQRWEDLHHLDQMIYAVRRIAFNLDERPFINPSSATSPRTVREALERSRDYSPRLGSSRLDKILNSTNDDDLRDAGLKYNFQFAPPNYGHPTTTRIGTSAANSALYQRIVRQAGRTGPSAGDQEAAALGEWVIGNIQLSKPIKNRLRGHIQTLRQRTP